MVASSLLDLRGEALPSDALAIRYEAREALSQPYEVDVELSTADASFRVDACLRTRMLLQLVDAKGGVRNFDGIVDRAEYAYVTGPRLHFRVRLRPSLAALAQREDCRIFQQKSVVDIASTIFTEAGIDQVEWQLAATYEPRDFVVQYRESQLDFVHRLFEDEGLFYFFRHDPSGHVLIVADAPAAFALMDDAPAVEFSMSQGQAGEPLRDFSRKLALRTTNVHLRDYDFEKPQAMPEAATPGPEAWPMPLYEYPGGFIKADVAKRRAKARLSSERRDADTVRGTSRAIGLRVGVPFLVDGAAQGCLNGEFVVTELRTWGEQTLESGGPNEVCHNAFVGIPKDAPWAPPRVTRRPRIRGVQTATVTGPSSAEQAIHVDKYGRVKVRFHWDRVGQQDDTASCWLRVSQLATGGSMILPRVGWEVAVAFQDGDPDRPFVLGRLYNAEKTPPYALPGTQTSGAIKSLSSPGGGGNNELKMGDSGGSQGFDLHAQKDLNVTIGHDKKETIDVDESHTVKVNMASSVGSNEKLEVGANQAIDVGADLQQKIGGDQSISVGGNESFDATANFLEKIGGDRSYSVGGNQIVVSNTVKQTLSGNWSRSVGAVELSGSPAALSTNVAGALTESVGAVKIELVKGDSAETVGGTKSLTSAAAELHLVKGNLETSADGGTTHLVGGLHYQKVAGDFSIKAPSITLLGGVGVFKGGGSELKLGGGPVVLKGDKIAIETAMLIKLGASLKLK
jgi:type VI secretion system secreted protein VgrG